MYEKSRELAQLSIQSWLHNEVFSFGWFLMIGTLVIAYAIWLKVVDRSRVIQLLLIGSLAAVAYFLNTIAMADFFGTVSYKIRFIPLYPPIFTSITISPIIIMLVQQYTSSWKGYLLNSYFSFPFSRRFFASSRATFDLASFCVRKYCWRLAVVARLNIIVRLKSYQLNGA